ncbi:MAG: radical SAM protein, partial [Deltaproteobacteria bacterium]|nr:radical SAM protein [Deltaproteobacteria bacterium]
GCPYGCLFCTSNPGLEKNNRKVRTVAIEKIEEWIAKWVKDYSTERIVVLDDVVNIDSRRFDALLSIFERFRLRLEIPNGLRADCINEEQIKRLKHLTSSIKVSLESASLRVQNEVLGKNLDPAAVEKVADWCRRQEVPLQIHYMIGIPGESRQEINATLLMAKHLFEKFGAQALLQFATPLAGSELDKLCKEKQLLVDEPDDIHACFQQGSIIETEQFNPEFLKIAADNFVKTVDPTRQRKVIVNLTYRCNNHCIFCAVGDRPKEDADIAAVTVALGRYRRQGFELLDIDGGEPTLHPGLFELIEQGRQLGFRKISLITNGRRASYRAYAKRLIDSGVDEILVSLHAAKPDLQALLSGSPDSYAQTLAGIDNLLRFIKDPDRLAVNTTLLKDNLSDCARLGEMLSKRGIRRWNLQVVTPFGRAQADQVPERAKLAALLGSLLSRPPGNMHIQVINCPPCFLPGFEEKAALDFGKAGRDMVFVGQHGENLQDFLAGRRKHDERCRECAYLVACPGFYVFEKQANKHD